MTTDEARQLYRYEKAKREELKKPQLDAARDALFRQLEIEKLARKGGRPKKVVGEKP